MCVAVGLMGQSHTIVGNFDRRGRNINSGTAFPTRDRNKWDMARTDVRWRPIPAFAEFPLRFLFLKSDVAPAAGRDLA